MLNVISWRIDVHTHTVYKHMLCKLQKAENIFMTRLAADEALATEVRAWDYFTVNTCIGEKATTVMKTSCGLFVISRCLWSSPKNACSSSKNEKNCKGKIKTAITTTPYLSAVIQLGRRKNSTLIGQFGLHFSA